MRPPNTVYRGERLYDRQMIVGVRVTVDGEPLSPERAQRLRRTAQGYEWGYGGGGPALLALALVLDATHDRDLALRTYHWFKWGVVSMFLHDEWEITAAEVRRWVQQCERERDTAVQYIELRAAMLCEPVRRCRVCGCTDWDCRQCIAQTGRPCSWVSDEIDLCTRCSDEEDAALAALLPDGTRIAEGGDR